MRNIFDQYKHPENRLTHALTCCLSEDPPLARSFARWIAPEWITGRIKLEIAEQQIPGRVEPESEDEAKGLPDAWLSDVNNDWAILIESKISARPGTDQLRRHLATAEAVGFGRVKVLLVAPERQRGRLHPRVCAKTWSDLYEWFGRREPTSEWASRFVDYLRVTEAKLSAEEYLKTGTLTRFDGFHFTEKAPYTAREGRRLIKLLRDELIRHKALRRLIDAKRPGRSAITGRDTGGVWDFVWLRAARKARNFTQFPHLTLGVHADHVEVAVTFPNGLRSDLRRRLVRMEINRFQRIMRAVEQNTHRLIKIAPGASPRVRINQRHFQSQRSVGTVDAELDFDLHTSFPNKPSRVKHQPQWLAAVLEVMRHKRANIQLQFWIRVPYSAHVTKSRRIADVVALGWLACEPLIREVITDA